MSEREQGQEPMTSYAKPVGGLKVKVWEGGTPYAVASVVTAVVASMRLWTLVPGALDRFAYGTCEATTSSVQLNWLQIGVAIAGGVIAIALANMGARRDGNRYISIVGSVVGISCVMVGILLAISLAMPPLSCPG